MVGSGVIDAGSKVSVSTNAGVDGASLPKRILILSPFPQATIFLRVSSFSIFQILDFVQKAKKKQQKNKNKNKKRNKLHAQNKIEI